jgi:hypothetical protein
MDTSITRCPLPGCGSESPIMPAPPAPSDWRDAVESHAKEHGIDLPRAIADELALHLDDLGRGPRRASADRAGFSG